MLRRFLAAAIPLAAASVSGTAWAADGPLAKPFRVEAGGQLIDVEVGHAAPFFADFDGDGRPDLLVGQFGGGKLRVYRNEADGTEAGGQQPRFKEYTWFKAGADLGVVPAG